MIHGLETQNLSLVKGFLTPYDPGKAAIFNFIDPRCVLNGHMVHSAVFRCCATTQTQKCILVLQTAKMHGAPCEEGNYMTSKLCYRGFYMCLKTSYSMFCCNLLLNSNCFKKNK